MGIKIALCDDDRRALPVIAGATKSAFEERNVKTQITCFRSAAELKKALETTHFQIYMLDIEMPGMDGIALGKFLREAGENAKIIYVSEAESRVFESFQVQPLGFVRKSNFLNDIAAVVELYLKIESREEKSDYLDLSTRNGILAIRTKQIRYIEGSRNYQDIYLDGKKDPIEVKMTMQQLEEITQPYGFIRIHKGYLVNYQYILRIAATDLTLMDGTHLPIGRSKATEVKTAYLSLIAK